MLIVVSKRFFLFVLFGFFLFSTKVMLLGSLQASRTEGVCDQLIDSDARALYEAGEGRKGKDCSIFIEILTTRSFPHLRKGLRDPCFA